MGKFGVARVLLAGSALGAAGPAFAQAAPALDNVVVTAQKRSEKIQDVPITITSLDAKKLVKLNIHSSDELANYVPAVQIAMPSGKGNQPLINIRGVGLNDTNTNNAGPNGVYVDEVYQASPAGQTFQTFDLSSVEVLKGPQGTLYGRNTTGGAINYITAKPTDQFMALEDVQYGSWNTVSTLSVINGAITPKVDGRLAVNYNYSDGYFSDLTTHTHTNGANDLAYRGQVKVEVTDDLKVLLNFHGGNVNRRPDEYRQLGELSAPLFGTLCNAAQIHAAQCVDLFGYKAPNSFYKGFYNRDQNLYINALGGSARVDYNLADFTITSLTGFETSHKNHPEDTDADPYDLLQINYGVASTDFTQEFHATGSGDRYNWLVGLYGLNEHLHQDQPVDVATDIDEVFHFPGLGDGIAEKAKVDNGQFTESYAAFGQGTYEILPRLRLTLGGRLTYEHKSFDAHTSTNFETNGTFPGFTELYNANEGLTDRAASYRAALDYRFTPDLLGYGSISTGFKSGDFNGGFLDNNPANALAQLKPIKPEYVTAYEIGLKSDWLQHRLRFNAAGFYYSYRDQQTYALIQPPASAAGGGLALPLTVLTNAPTSTIKGAEFELDATPLRNLTTSATFAYVDAVLGRFVTTDAFGTVENLSGTQLANSPRFNVILQGDYSFPLARGDVLDLSGTASYRSHQFFESTNNPLVAQNAYWLLDGRLSYDTPDKRWEISAIGKNLLGQKYYNYANDLTASLGLLEFIVGPPRYVGGEVRYRF